MTGVLPHAQTIGAHPLTGKLVGALRQGVDGMVFEVGALDGFRLEGAKLDPEEQALWIRELGTLAITLRNDLVAPEAARQLEHELIDPLCRTLEGAPPRAKRPNAVKELVNAERRRTTGPQPSVAPKPGSTVAAALRSQRRRNR
jgi:hypothetical protein